MIWGLYKHPLVHRSAVRRYMHLQSVGALERALISVVSSVLSVLQDHGESAGTAGPITR